MSAEYKETVAGSDGATPTDTVERLLELARNLAD